MRFIQGSLNLGVAEPILGKPPGCSLYLWFWAVGAVTGVWVCLRFLGSGARGRAWVSLFTFYVFSSPQSLRIPLWRVRPVYGRATPRKNPSRLPCEDHSIKVLVRLRSCSRRTVQQDTCENQACTISGATPSLKFRVLTSLMQMEYRCRRAKPESQGDKSLLANSAKLVENKGGYTPSQTLTLIVKTAEEGSDEQEQRRNQGNR